MQGGCAFGNGNWRAAKQELSLWLNLPFPCQGNQAAPRKESQWPAVLLLTIMELLRAIPLGR